jgi:hypothetical protein
MIPSSIIALVVHVAAALSCLADGRTGFVFGYQNASLSNS